MDQGSDSAALIYPMNKPLRLRTETPHGFHAMASASTPDDHGVKTWDPRTDTPNWSHTKLDGETVRMVETCWSTIIPDSWDIFGISKWFSGFQSSRVPWHLGSHTKDLIVFLVRRNNAVHLSRIEQANHGELCCVYYHLLSCDPLTSMYSTIHWEVLKCQNISQNRIACSLLTADDFISQPFFSHCQTGFYKAPSAKHACWLWGFFPIDSMFFKPKVGWNSG